ncbi:MAG: prenyltransferase/squalene oxidase repeat-containing protein [Bryobacteraceae bacterium]
MNRRTFLGAIACARADLSARALQRGANYLWSRQSAGGGWHSNTYGLLRSGHSLTPLVLLALTGIRKERRAVRALAFITRAVNSDGALGLTDDDYPCYATALGLRAIVQMEGRSHPLVPRMVAWLKCQQMSPHNGWTADHPAFGAWGLGGLQPLTAPHCGHIDLSMTRHVLEALADAGVPPTDQAMVDALVFVRRCRNTDGGFFFSTVETGANKAGESASGFEGYGTATADGILSLIAAGDPGVAPSLAWLRSHDHPELPQGFPSAARLRYAEGLRYYYADAATRAFHAAGHQRSVPFAAALHRSQRRDGSWANAEPLVKEDDPLIATAFAISACNYSRRAESNIEKRKETNDISQ